MQQGQKHQQDMCCAPLTCHIILPWRPRSTWMLQLINTNVTKCTGALNGLFAFWNVNQIAEGGGRNKTKHEHKVQRKKGYRIINKKRKQKQNASEQKILFRFQLFHTKIALSICCFSFFVDLCALNVLDMHTPCHSGELSWFDRIRFRCQPFVLYFLFFLLLNCVYILIVSVISYFPPVFVMRYCLFVEGYFSAIALHTLTIT